MNEPDFDQWASNIEHHPRNYVSLQTLISLALKDAYKQGKSLGYREGYQVGLEKGWAIEQDKHNA